MPHTQRCEGPHLEELLLEVRERFGPNPRIVAANRLRKGGVGGFFAKEHFEVIVEFDEMPPRRRAEDRVAPTGAARHGAAANGTARPGAARPATAPAGGARPAGDLQTELLRRAEQTSEAERRQGAASGRPGFDAVLENIRRDAGPVPSPGRSAGGPASAASARRPVPSAPTGRSAVPARPASASANAHPARPARSARAVPASSAAVPSTRRTYVSPAALRRVGLPASWLEDLRVPYGPERLGVIAAAFDEQVRVAPPLSTGPGDVVAVVGRTPWAIQLAADLAIEAGHDPRQVVVVTPYFVPPSAKVQAVFHDADDIAVERPHWTASGEPIFLAIGTADDPGDAAWAARAVAAAAPTSCWGVVQASQKSADIRAWARRLGGLDAIAVNRLSATESPATVLTAGIPVARLDGQPATPAMWAALVDDRLNRLERQAAARR